MSDALQAIRWSFVKLWPLWLVLIAVTVAGGHWVRANMDAQVGLSTEKRLAYSLVMAPVGAVLLGVWTRALLGLGRASWRLDRGLATYVVVSTGIALTYVWPEELAAIAIRAAIADPMGAWWGVFVSDAAIWWVLLWPVSKLLLWPMRHLMGDPSGTPAASWRDMRGAVWPYVVAYVALSTPLYLVDFWAWEQFYLTGSLAMIISAAIADIVWDALACGLAATVYRVVILERRRLADVFD